MWLLSVHGTVLNSREATQGQPGFDAATSAVMGNYIILSFINEYISPWSTRPSDSWADIVQKGPEGKGKSRSLRYSQCFYWNRASLPPNPSFCFPLVLVYWCVFVWKSSVGKWKLEYPYIHLFFFFKKTLWLPHSFLCLQMSICWSPVSYSKWTVLYFARV